MPEMPLESPARGEVTVAGRTLADLHHVLGGLVLASRPRAECQVTRRR